MAVRIQDKWWTRMQRIRTLAEIEFHFAAPIENFFLYRIFAAKAHQLHSVGMSFVEIGKVLGITDKTAKKAVLATTQLNLLKWISR